MAPQPAIEKHWEKRAESALKSTSPADSQAVLTKSL